MAKALRVRQTLDAEAYRQQIERALVYADGVLGFSDVKKAVEDGVMQLWVGENEDAVMVTELVDYPAKRVARVVAIAGALRKYKDQFDLFLAWAKMNGACEVEAWCRPAVARLLRRYGFEKRQEIVRRPV